MVASGSPQVHGHFACCRYRYPPGQLPVRLDQAGYGGRHGLPMPLVNYGACTRMCRRRVRCQHSGQDGEDGHFLLRPPEFD
jgi:hypothetical protein